MLFFLKYYITYCLFYNWCHGFSNIPGKYENVVFIIKNPRNRKKCFQKLISEHKKYYKISTIYECVEKLSMIIGCNIWMICLELNWFFYDPIWMLQLSEFVWTLRSSALVVFNNFLLSFFANTPFERCLILTIKALCLSISKFHREPTVEINKTLCWRKIWISHFPGSHQGLNGASV